MGRDFIFLVKLFDFILRTRVAVKSNQRVGTREHQGSGERRDTTSVDCSGPAVRPQSSPTRHSASRDWAVSPLSLNSSRSGSEQGKQWFTEHAPRREPTRVTEARGLGWVPLREGVTWEGRRGLTATGPDGPSPGECAARPLGAARGQAGGPRQRAHQGSGGLSWRGWEPCILL